MPEISTPAAPPPQPLVNLTEDETLFRENVRQFAEDSLRPKVREMDEKGVFERGLIDQFFQLGLMGIEIPEPYGGAGGTFFEAILAVEEVSRIDPSVQNGTVTVDVHLTSEMPKGARSDLSVDGTIQLEKLDNVLYVGRPVHGQENSTIGLFKYDETGQYANRVQVRLGKSSVNTIEILDGLKEGDKVILSDTSQFDNADRIRIN